MSETAPGESGVRDGRLVIFASSLGTAFEFFDFYLFGLLATYISAQFFSGVNETTAFIFALATFAAGFAVRPFGALIFGRIGDIVGRKHTFLVTMAIIGLSTFAVGLLPSYERVGIISPIMLICLRLLQGLAIGGEYGGATTYVSEHAPPGKRGFFTGWIQTTATLGLVTALFVVITVRGLSTEHFFATWGWRIPFLASIVLLAISMWIRLKLDESPIFQKMKREGTVSKAPLTEAFGQWKNLRWVLVALFGAVTGQAVIGYTSQFYSIFFMERMLKVDGAITNSLFLIALVLAAPFTVFCGWLSDRIGRKPIVVGGCALAALCYFPLFGALTRAANPDLAQAQITSPVVVMAHQPSCSLQFDPVGRNTFDRSSCDIAKSLLAHAGTSYSNRDTANGTPTVVEVGGVRVSAPEPGGMTPDAKKAAIATFKRSVDGALAQAGYPAKADPGKIDRPKVVLIFWVMMLFVSMAFGPLAALLVELFPTRVRYSSISLPFHIGNGWFGGFMPTTAFAMVASTGDMYFGLWYAVIIAGATAVIGLIFLPETFRRDISQ